MYEGFYSSSSMIPLYAKLTVVLLPLAIASHAAQTLPVLRVTIAQNAARLAYNGIDDYSSSMIPL